MAGHIWTALSVIVSVTRGVCLTALCKAWKMNSQIGTRQLWGFNVQIDTDKMPQITAIRSLFCQWANPQLTLISLTQIIHPIRSAAGSQGVSSSCAGGKEKKAISIVMKYILETRSPTFRGRQKTWNHNRSNIRGDFKRQKWKCTQQQ